MVTQVKKIVIWPILLKGFKRWFEGMVVYHRGAVQEQYKQNPDKAAKRNPVPDKRFSQKSAADNIVKQTLAAWGDSSSESEREPDAENSSMMAVETKATKYDSLFALMAQSDDGEEDENDEVNFRDVQRNLKSYSYKKLRSLANVLIDAYYSLDNDKEILSIELGEAEQFRDDLVVCVVDLNETITNLEKEKEVLNEKINSVENERDDLIVVVVDLKETIEGLSNEKHTLEEKIAATDQERHDFLVIITDLEETIEGLILEHRIVSIGKGNEVSNKTQIKFEKELNGVKTSLCGKLEKNRYLQAELEKARVQSVQKNKVFTEKVTTKEGPAKVYKVCNKIAQYVEESGNELFNKTPSSNKGGNSNDQDNELLLVHGKYLIFQMGKADMMIQMKETGEDNATFSSTSHEEPGT
ncbi:uncharacterized protein [Nicotiana sylvestris]|uniref:uncharacterized protein n=1 Tax=Nicotiana sylvestris TaxID=4096 RepID=UPI00388C5126